MKNIRLILAGCILAGSMSLFAACGDNKNDSAHNDSAGEHVKDAGSEVIDGAKDAGSEVIDGAKDVGEAAADGAADVGEAAVDGAADVGEAAVDGTRDMGEAAKAGADELTEDRPSTEDVSDTTGRINTDDAEKKTSSAKKDHKKDRE